METITKTETAAEKTARVFGCTVERAKEMFAKNAVGLAEMLTRAEKTGRKVNGYTAEALRGMVEQARQRAAGIL